MMILHHLATPRDTEMVPNASELRMSHLPGTSHTLIMCLYVL